MSEAAIITTIGLDGHDSELFSFLPEEYKNHSTKITKGSQ